MTEIQIKTDKKARTKFLERIKKEVKAEKLNTSYVDEAGNLVLMS